MEPEDDSRRRASQDDTSRAVGSGWPGLARYAGMGIELGSAIIGLTLAGLWVDYKFHTGHKGLVIGATLGIVGGLYNFIKQALALSRTQLPTDTKGRETVQHDDTTRSR